MKIVIDLNDSFVPDLEAAAQQTGLAPRVFASQAVEVVLAERRLATLPPAKLGAFERKPWSYEEMT